jgi:hypothetical protein
MSDDEYKNPVKDESEEEEVKLAKDEAESEEDVKLNQKASQDDEDYKPAVVNETKAEKNVKGEEAVPANVSTVTFCAFQ